MSQKPEPILAPSLLAGDHANLAGSAREIVECGLEWAHLDIMDGHFVDNLTFGPQMLRDLRKHVPELFYDVHLMLDNPQAFVDPFIDAGAGNVTIHIEPGVNHRQLLEHIRERGATCAISLNPATQWERIQHLLDCVDMVLVMTVHPGRGGQPFREDMLEKIEQIANWRDSKGLGYRIEVDGGVDAKTGRRCRDAGADTFVAGTAFYKAQDRKAFVEAFA